MQKKLKLKLEKARRESSVVAINENARGEAEGKNIDFLSFGVKDTERFPTDIFGRVRANKDCLWLTVDRMADRGRSIDTGLVNPLTYRPMTGSTSGGAVNILLGINDFALGTDGGGSVLAPALAGQLPSCILAGLGFFAEGEPSVSTDGLTLRPSIGIIARTFDVLKKALSVVLDKELPDAKPFPRVAIPREGDLTLPDGKDMAAKLAPFVRETGNRFRFEAIDLRGAEERQKGVDLCRGCFDRGFDLILTHEGPVDVLGYGETIPAMFGGVGPELAKRGGKYLLKAANPCGATALTVPSDELASGFVILAPGGGEAAGGAFALAEALARLVALPEVFVRYFLTAERMSGGFETGE